MTKYLYLFIYTHNGDGNFIITFLHTDFLAGASIPGAKTPSD